MLKYLDEYRDADTVNKLSEHIKKITRQNWTIMEICGGQTHSIIKFGIDELIPKKISLIHGPGCPVCVTPIEIIDKAIEIAGRKDVIFCSFGDMLRVPGSKTDLLSVKAHGGDVRTVYSPMDALKITRANPSKQVVFFAVGFETTAPGNAMAVYQARSENLKNFSMLVAHVLVPPAIRALLSSPQNHIQGFLAAGHVCTVMGWEEYEPIAEQFRVPIVVTGFEPVDIMQGIAMCVQQLENGSAKVENQYTRSVRKQGNPLAKKMINRVFEIVDRKWRGIGTIPASGLALRKEFCEFDAELRFGVESLTTSESTECIAGLILQGSKKPSECPAFGKSCTPENPLGAPMVSSEGACSAYYRYRFLTLRDSK
ncbi:MAG: hydrogenase formation protein HypD [Verrucomicrobiae bacterium]|nr:hydrogenase formation protein HypD [Verrucomicrobiae bacterium]